MKTWFQLWEFFWISLQFLTCYQTFLFWASGFPNLLFRFFRRTLNHDNVVKLHGVGIKGPRNFMVQENMSNGNIVLLISRFLLM